MGAINNDEKNSMNKQIESEAESMASKKQAVSNVFNTVASGYDNAALRWFPFAADVIVDLLKPVPGSKFLDIATGTGVVAVAAAQAVAAHGRVMAIDLAENMLQQAMAKAKHLQLNHIEFFTMDAEALDFRTDYFDNVACSFGLFFLADMPGALRSWKRVTRSGGRLVFTSFAQSAFQPMMQLYLDDLQSYGIEMGQARVAMQRLMDPAVGRAMMQECGYLNVDVHTKQCGYHLQNVNEWWDVLWNSGTRGLLNQLEEQDLLTFKTQHLNQVKNLFVDDKLWLDVQVNFTYGVAP